MMDKSINQGIKDFSTLGEVLSEFLTTSKSPHTDEINTAIQNSCMHNKWFTQDSIRYALKGICSWLTKEALEKWVATHKYSSTQKKVAVLMAGNIPIVGFHDFLSVLISGHSILIKPSDKDKYMLSLMASLLTHINPSYKQRISFVLQLKDKQFDAIIATGSNTSSKYFNHYFGKYPSIIRGHRNAIGILKGNETDQEINALSNDIFQYYGLGCRNVSKLYVPEGYNFKKLEKLGEQYTLFAEHNKFMNNYQYYKTIFALNKQAFFDRGFFLLKPDKSLAAFPAVIHYEHYTNEEHLNTMIKEEETNIQCIVNKEKTAHWHKFGEAQKPLLHNYADNINTLDFLFKL